MTAHFRGWNPLIALQIEYSLLERTVEMELTPMAREMGLGVTPWSPLRFGILSGKYTRENIATANPGRGMMITALLNETAHRVLEVLRRVAKELGTTPARVALAWLLAQPGVTSPIIGARTVEQLDDNIGAADAKISAEQLAALNEVSKPQPTFPMSFLEHVVNFARAGVTLEGKTFPVIRPNLPISDDERY